MKAIVVLSFQMFFFGSLIGSTYYTAVDTTKNEKIDSLKSEPNNPNTLEWFNGGKLDFISSGLLRPTANVMVFNLGNPNKFYLPFYLLIGATSDIYQDGLQLNEIAVADLINSDGGFINFGINGENQIGQLSDISALAVAYQLGAKSISGVSMEYQENVGFLSSMVNLGLVFSTIAWRPEMPDDHGKAWIKYYFSISKNNIDKMKLLFGNRTGGIIYGSNIEGGIELKDFAKIRFGFYKYLNNQQVDFFENSLFKLAAEFAMDH